MQVVIWGEEENTIKSVLSPWWLPPSPAPDLFLLEVLFSSKEVLSDVVKNTRSWSDFKLRTGREAPRLTPPPGKSSRSEPAILLTLAGPYCRRSGALQLSVCIYATEDDFWCVPCKGKICVAVVFVGP